MATEQFCLKWNNFQSNIISNLESLKCDEDLVDVTLTCEGKSVKAHKVILSACSSYFRAIFKENPCSHPIVILKGVAHRDISALINFMYQGEVNIQEDQLSSFLRTAEHLQIKGLADVMLPDEMLMSEPFDGKEQNRASHICPSSTLEENFPHQNSPPRTNSSNSSPATTCENKPLQGMPVSQQPLIHPPATSDLDTDDGNVDPERWRVDPKTEPMESENFVMQHQNEESNNQKIYSNNWPSMPPCSSDISPLGRLDLAQRRFERTPVPLHSALQDPLGNFPCPFCKKIISNKSNLQKHMKIMHSNILTQEACGNCGKVLKNKYGLRRHSMNHCVMNKTPKPK